VKLGRGGEKRGRKEREKILGDTFYRRSTKERNQLVIFGKGKKRRRNCLQAKNSWPSRHTCCGTGRVLEQAGYLGHN